jgi:hypothetical protein
MAHPGVKSEVVDSGNATVLISHNQLGLFWRLHQISVDTGGVFQVQCRFNGLPCTSLKTGTSPVTASGEPAIDIGGHDTLSVVISNATNGVNATVTYFYEEIQGAP